MNGWQCSIVTDPIARTEKLLIYQRQMHGVVHVIEAELVVKVINEAEQYDGKGITLPVDAAAAVGEALHPGPSQGEMVRLEEALDIERQRVDKILAHATTPLYTAQA